MIPLVVEIEMIPLMVVMATILLIIAILQVLQVELVQICPRNLQIYFQMVALHKKTL